MQKIELTEGGGCYIGGIAVGVSRCRGGRVTLFLGNTSGNEADGPIVHETLSEVKQAAFNELRRLNHGPRRLTKCGESDTMPTDN